MKTAQLFLVMALVAGMLIPFQGAINGLLSKSMQHPLQATFISFAGGTALIIVLLLFLNPSLPPADTFRKLPWYLYIGGALGVFFVTAALLAVPRIGATTFLAAVLAGQMAGALLIDQFGWFQVPVQPISLKRVLAIVFLALGVWLAQK